jgi:neurotransmitter:Na+ symporter, NSS family
MESQKNNSNNNKWSRNIFFVFACVGAAVGLGNLWRFPYVAYKNGGGAFLIPYLVCIILIGIPICLLEIGLGRWSKGSIASAYFNTKKKLSWIGWWVLINSIVVVSYYCVVLSWCVQYLVLSFTEGWGNEPAKFFTQNILHLTNSPTSIGSINWFTVLALLVVWLAIYAIIRGGIKWISRVLILTVPLPLIILIVFAVNSSTMPGASEGINYFITPNFSKIFNYSVWAAAAAQVILSLGLGMGQVVAYASKKRDDSGIVKSAVSICFLDLFFSLLAGIITFAMMGFLAHSKGIAFTDLKLDGLFLAFVSYPLAISSLPGAPIWGVLFFLLLISLGIDSAFAAVEATLVGAEEMTPRKKRNVISLLICCIGFLGGVIFTTGSGLYWLDIIDHWVETYAITSLIVLECIVFAWFAPIDKISKIIGSSWSKFPHKTWKFLLKFILPVLLLIVFIGNIYSEGLMSYGGYSVASLTWIGWGVFGSVVLTAIVFSFFYISNYKKSD